MKKPIQFVGLGLLTAAAYIATARMGLTLAFVAEQVTVVWPPTGIALCAVLLLGYRIWPAITVGAFIANILTNAPPLTALGIATGNTLEALTGAYLLNRFVGFRPSLERFRDVFGLIFFGALMSTAVSATIGVVSLCATGLQRWAQFGPLWGNWYLGDAMGDVLVAPVVLTLSRRECRMRLRSRGLIEFTALIVILTGLDLFVFGNYGALGPKYLSPHYAIFPILIWAALRFSTCGTAIGALITASIAVLGTVTGFGPFTAGGTNENLISLQLLHPDDLQRVGEVWQRSLATRTPHENEFRVMAADGTYRTVFARALPVLEADGTVREWVGTVTDITEKKRAEREMQEADLRKDQFLAMLAHELRNPLAPIRNAVEIIRTSKSDPARIDWTCEIMVRQIHHMSRLLDDLLDVSRITRGQIGLSRQPTDLKTLVERCLDAARTLMKNKQLRLATDFVPGPVPISADVTRIEQVITNLLNNAMKFTPSGGRVSVTVDREGDMAVLRVRDNGRGIASELLPKIFDLFTQGDRSLARSEGGLGIGLTLVQNLVRMHSGIVQAKSEGPGHGSEFTVRLPMLPVVPLAAAQKADEPAGSLHEKRRVLVVEDNVDSAETLAAMVDVMGHEAHVAHDGEEALELFAQVKPSVVLLDVGLPRMSGFEVAERLRAARRNENLKIIVLTGYGSDSDRERSKAAGFDHHLVKPVDFDVLEKLLR